MKDHSNKKIKGPVLLLDTLRGKPEIFELWFVDPRKVWHLVQHLLLKSQSPHLPRINFLNSLIISKKGYTSKERFFQRKIYCKWNQQAWVQSEKVIKLGLFFFFVKKWLLFWGETQIQSYVMVFPKKKWTKLKIAFDEVCWFFSHLKFQKKISSSVPGWSCNSNNILFSTEIK